MSANISRRNFIKGMAAGAVGLAATGILGSKETVAAAAGTEAAAPAAVPAWTQLNPQADDLESCTTDFAELFSPIQVGPMKLRNRIIKSAAGSDTLPRKATEMSQNTIDYYGRFADGGAALVILEDGVTGGFGINQFSQLKTATYEEGIAEIKKVADRVHEGDVGEEGDEVGLVLHHAPAHLHEHGRAAEVLNVRQCFRQDGGFLHGQVDFFHGGNSIPQTPPVGNQKSTRPFSRRCPARTSRTRR